MIIMCGERHLKIPKRIGNYRVLQILSKSYLFHLKYLGIFESLYK